MAPPPHPYLRFHTFLLALVHILLFAVSLGSSQSVEVEVALPCQTAHDCPYGYWCEGARGCVAMSSYIRPEAEAWIHTHENTRRRAAGYQPLTDEGVTTLLKDVYTDYAKGTAIVEIEVTGPGIYTNPPFTWNLDDFEDHQANWGRHVKLYGDRYGVADDECWYTLFVLRQAGLGVAPELFSIRQKSAPKQRQTEGGEVEFCHYSYEGPYVAQPHKAKDETADLFQTSGRLWQQGPPGHMHYSWNTGTIKSTGVVLSLSDSAGEIQHQLHFKLTDGKGKMSARHTGWLKKISVRQH